MRRSVGLCGRRAPPVEQEVIREGVRLLIPAILKRAWKGLATWQADRRKRRTFQAGLDRMLGDYLGILCAEHNWLRLVELLSGEEARAKTHLAQTPEPLEKVYVPLTTTLPAEPAESRRRPAMGSGLYNLLIVGAGGRLTRFGFVSGQNGGKGGGRVRGHQ